MSKIFPVMLEVIFPIKTLNAMIIKKITLLNVGLDWVLMSILMVWLQYCIPEQNLFKISLPMAEI